MPGTTHPLDKWFRRKPRIRQAGVEAILIDDAWEQFFAKHHDWTTGDVIRVRSLLRPEQAEIEEFLAGASLSPTIAEAWRRPQGECFEGSRLQAPRFADTIFHLDVDGITGLEGWTASEFTSKWALFCLCGDHRLSGSTIPHWITEYPLGFITRSHRFESAALLLSKATDRAIRIEARQRWEPTSIGGNITPVEAYRMLLGLCGLATTRVLRMSPEKLKKYRPAGAGWDYTTVESVYELDRDYEYCPICGNANVARSCDVGLCRHFVAKAGEGMISENSGIFTDFERAWDGASEWCQTALDELGKSKLRELLLEICTELMLPDEVADLLIDENRAESAFTELIDFEQGRDFSEFYNLYLENPRDIKNLSKALHRMSGLLQRARRARHGE